MKTLLLLRHAKAQPDAPHGDHERALTEQGKADAAHMGSFLPTLPDRIDLIVTSDARRAQQTTEIAASAAGYSGEIMEEADIYDADLDALLNVVRDLSDEASCVMLVGHNPGFEELSAALASEGARPPRLPTCGLAHLLFEVARWGDVRPGTGKLLGVYTPKSV